MGKSKAQKLLYQRFSDNLLGVALRYVKRKEDAEDILQEAFVKIFFKIKELDDLESFNSWIKKIVINESLNYYKKKKREKTESIDDTEKNNEEVLIDNSKDINSTIYDKSNLEYALNQLDNEQKQIFNLYAIDGYKHKEISELLNINESTTRQKYKRAREKIKKTLEEL